MDDIVLHDIHSDGRENVFDTDFMGTYLNHPSLILAKNQENERRLIF